MLISCVLEREKESRKSQDLVKKPTQASHLLTEGPMHTAPAVDPQLYMATALKVNSVSGMKEVEVVVFHGGSPCAPEL